MMIMMIDRFVGIKIKIILDHDDHENLRSSLK
jgi:hypothetical protein